MRRTGVDDCAPSLKTRMGTGRARLSHILPIQGRGEKQLLAVRSSRDEAAQMSVFPDSESRASEADNPQPCPLRPCLRIDMVEMIGRPANPTTSLYILLRSSASRLYGKRHISFVAVGSIGKGHPGCDGLISFHLILRCDVTE